MRKQLNERKILNKLSKLKQLIQGNKINESNLSVANTILDQLGNNKFIAMTGAKQFVGSEDSLTFRLPRGSKLGINMVRIKLNDDDLYDIEFGTFRKMEFKVKKSFDDIYVDQLQEIFTRVTGLDTHL